MTKHTLPATKRTVTGRKVKSLRREGHLPASLFGKEVSSQNLTLNAKAFQKLYTEVGESGLVYLQIESAKVETPVIFSEVTIHPVTGIYQHVSLRQVSLTEKIKAPVKIEITGKSPAVADGLGVLVQQADEIEIEALPQDFPENITIDISSLTEVDAAVTVKDLKVSSKLEILTDPETILVKIDPLAKEEPKVEVTAETATAEAVPAGEPAPAAETEKK